MSAKHFTGNTHRELSLGRLTVEWYFGVLKSQWKYLSCFRNFAIQRTPLAHTVTSIVLMSNAHAILYGNIASRKFNYSPPGVPGLNDYFRP